MIHAINDTNVSIKEILNMSDVSYRIIEKLNLDNKYTHISKVVEQLENLLSTFNDPLSESDSGYTSDNVLSRSTSETQHTVKYLNTHQSESQLSKLVMNELNIKIQNFHTNDDVNAAGEHLDTH